LGPKDRSGQSTAPDIRQIQQALQDENEMPAKPKMDLLPSNASTALYGLSDDASVLQYTELVRLYPIIFGQSFYPLRKHITFDGNPTGDVWLGCAMQDEAFLNTIMLSTAVTVAAHNPRSLPGITQVLTRSAIGVISKRISLEVLTDATLAAVSCMALIEAVLGNEVASLLHHRGLVEAVKLRGGMSSVGPALRTKIYRAAMLPSVDRLEAPRLSRLNLGAPTLLVDNEEDQEEERAYASTLGKVGLELDLIDILACIWRVSKAIQIAHRTKIPVNYRSFDESTMNIYHALLSRSRSADSALSRAANYAAIIYMNTFTRERPFDRNNSQAVAKALRAALLELNPMEDANDISLWAVFMGALASTNTDEKEWFRDLLSSMAITLGITTWAECESVLVKTGWIAQVHGTYGESLWNEINGL
jgi:hypothetical protein